MMRLCLGRTERYALEQQYGYHLSHNHGEYDKCTCQSVKLTEIEVVVKLVLTRSRQCQYESLECSVGIYAGNHREQRRESKCLGRAFDTWRYYYGEESDDDCPDKACRHDVD